MEHLQFKYPGSGGIRNRCIGEAKKNSQGGYYGTPLILISGK
jgi:hypothetical protein